MWREGCAVKSSNDQSNMLIRGLRLIERLAETSEQSLSELADHLATPAPTVLRHLRVLEDEGYVWRDPASKRFSLAPRLVYLGMAAAENLQLPRVAAPVLNELRDEYNETAHVAVLSRHEVIHLAVAASRHPVKMATKVGERAWAHASALGKCLLAFESEESVRELFEEVGIPGFTEHTITDLDALVIALQEVRSAGFAIDNEEAAIGLRCVAAPVCDFSGHAIAALSLSCPADRLPLQRAIAIAPNLIEAANDLSARLGQRRDHQERTVQA